MRTEKKRSRMGELLRRNAVVAAVGLFVCAAVYLNWEYEQQAQVGKTLGRSELVSGETADPIVTTDAAEEEQSVTLSEQSGSGYFASARLNRQQARDSALSLLQDAAAREDADETMKTQVNDTIQTMADCTITEAQIENLVTAKGYADCVAFIGEEDISLAVAAPAGGLTRTDTARIVDVVLQSADFTAEQIKIIEVS